MHRMKLANIGIVKKFGFLSLLGAIEIAVVAGLALWMLKDSGAASAKAQTYAHKMNLALEVSDSVSKMELILSNLEYSSDTTGDILRYEALRKRYADALDYFKKTATTDTDRGLIAKIDQVLSDTSEKVRPVLAAAQARKPLAGPRLYKESQARFASFQTAQANYVKYRQQRAALFEGERQALASRLNLMIICLTLFSLATLLTLATSMGKSIAAPLAETVGHLKQIAAGDISGEIPSEALGRQDEIGVLNRAMQIMATTLRSMIDDVSSGITTLASSSAQLSDSSSQMSGGSRDASDKAHSVAAAAEQMTANATSVAASMEETATNLAHVASATEEMTATILEIAGNSEKARVVTNQAALQIIQITTQIAQLSQAAQEIGKVTETITEISAQINVLALNATIEAARAGSAGKGFAVVASEIKALAQQTAAASEDIKARIASVQSETSGGVAEIEKVSQVIREVTALVTSIAAAIEEQSGATKNIACNVSEASTGVADVNIRVTETSNACREIAMDIQMVDRVAGDMTAGSNLVLASANGLSKVADRLKTTLSHFKV